MDTSMRYHITLSTRKMFKNPLRIWMRSGSFSTLVSTEWLANNMNMVKIVDGSWHMPATQRKGKIEFLEKRITDSRFFDIDMIADQSSSLPHMLPDSGAFAKNMGDMGISESDHIVIYDSSGFGPSCRVFWTFKVFGHERVSVLNGGLVKWMLENRPIISGPLGHFTKCTYNARFVPHLVKNYNDIQTVLREKSCQILDARPAGRFSGLELEPRPGISSGHMPTAINIPFTELVDPMARTLIPKDQLESLFKKNGVDLEKPIITTCGSGVTASMIYFALDYLGLKNISVYDGSWTEYASTPSSIIIFSLNLHMISSKIFKIKAHMRLSMVIVLLATALAAPLPGICDQEANDCLIRLSQLTSFDQCGMPPSTAATTLDPESLQWGLCACPILVPVFECFRRFEESCPGAKQYIGTYGDQVEKGCKVVDWAKKQQTESKYKFFWK